MADQQAIFHTNLGDITVDLFGNHAPETVANFTGLAMDCPPACEGRIRPPGDRPCKAEGEEVLLRES